jgi:SAM-dependent methyltransferase
MPALRARYGLAGTVLDVASGTGRSTFALAGWARRVVGLEPWEPMLTVAERRQRALGLGNVAFVRGAAEALPFAPRSLDHAVSVWGFPVWFPDAGELGRKLGRRFVAACRAVVRPGGWVVAVEGAPNQAAGELTRVVLPETLVPEDVGPRDRYMAELGFRAWDLDVVADYGTVEEAVATYGFIFGRRAIAHLRAHDVSRVAWRLRVQELRIGG